MEERNIVPLPCDGKKNKFEMTGDCLECDYFNFCSKLKEEHDSPYTG